MCIYTGVGVGVYVLEGLLFLFCLPLHNTFLVALTVDIFFRCFLIIIFSLVAPNPVQDENIRYLDISEVHLLQLLSIIRTRVSYIFFK